MIFRSSIIAFLSIFLFVESLQCQESEFGLITLSVANVRSEPRHSSELSSQAFAGTPVKLCDKSGEWFFVELPEGYKGYIHESSIALKSSSDMARWRDSKRVIVMTPGTVDLLADTINVHPIMKGELAVSDLTGGCILERIDEGERFSLLMLPDGRTGFVDKEHLMDIDEWRSQGTDTWQILAIAKAQIGIPYLWGGISAKGCDCSGLVKNSYFSTGLILKRDASEQASTGVEIPVWRPDLWKQGDLLFFTGDDGKKITHVAIYDKDGEYIHSSGMAKRSSIYKNSPIYLDREVKKVVRIAGNEDTDGITTVRNHNWYFNNQ